MINHLMQTTSYLTGEITQAKREAALRKAKERDLTMMRGKQQAKQEEAKGEELDAQDKEDLLDYIFGDAEGEHEIPSTLGDDGDVHVPQWIRNAADPLGLGLLPTDDQINGRISSQEQVEDILDITPKTKKQARQQLKALYDEEPTDEAVDNYWNSLNSSPNWKPAWMTPDGVLISQDPRYLAEHENAMTWDQYTQTLTDEPKKEAWMSPDGILISQSSRFLRENPGSMTWQEYTNRLGREERKPAFMTPDGVLVSEDLTYLRENPKAMTWTEYSRRLDPAFKPAWMTPDGYTISEDRIYLRENPASMRFQQYLSGARNNQGANNQRAKPVDQKVVDDAVEELTSILGRKPTAIEVEDFLKDANEITGMQAGFNPLDPFGFSQDLPNAPYTIHDAIKEIRDVLGREPTDVEVNDWLHEMNEPFAQDPMYLDSGLPGYTEQYGDVTDNSSMFGSSSIMLLLIAAGAAGLAYRRSKQKNPDDDEFVKTNSNSSLLGRLRNPFKRDKRGDGDDDFDQVL